MGALIAGTRPSCASNMDVVLAGRIPAQGLLQNPWVGAAETAPLFTHFLGCARKASKELNALVRLAPDPFRGDLTGSQGIWPLGAGAATRHPY